MGTKWGSLGRDVAQRTPEGSSPNPGRPSNPCTNKAQGCTIALVSGVVNPVHDPPTRLELELERAQRSKALKRTAQSMGGGDFVHEESGLCSYCCGEYK